MIERFRRVLARRRAIKRQVDMTPLKPSVLLTALVVKRRLREQGFEISTDEACRWIVRRRWIG